MNDRLSLVDVLEIAGFKANARTAVVEFCCENLRELVLLPSKDLDAAISNLHKALANVIPAWNRVCLNATKYITLNVLCMQYLDRINCNAPYTADDIVSLTPDSIDS